MANIIISFYQPQLLSDGMLCYYDAFVQELAKTNNIFIFTQNYIWNGDFPPIDEQRTAEIKAFSPDLIIAFNNSFFDVSDLVDCPIIIYGADTAKYYSNKTAIKKKPDRYKYVVFSESSYACLMEMLSPNPNDVGIIPVFSSVYAKEIEQDINISFIGSNFAHAVDGKAPIARFMSTSPSQEDLEIYKNCLDDFFKNPLLDFEKYKENNSHLPCIILDNFNHKLLSYFSSIKRIQVLSQVADLGLTIFGPATWRKICWESDLAFCYNDRSILTLEENSEIYNRSKLSLNINHVQAVNSFSWRLCDILASNACLVTEYKPILAKRFPTLNLPTFTNRYEARKICIKLLENENMRRDITLASQEIIDAKYRFKHILPLFEELSGVNLSVKKDSSCTQENTIYKTNMVLLEKQDTLLERLASKTLIKSKRIIRLLVKIFKEIICYVSLKSALAKLFSRH